VRSGETESPDWTTGTALRYMQMQHDDLVVLLDERHTAQQAAISAALASAKEAVTKAETANERRFDSVNEFRQTLSDQTNTFLPRPEYEAAHSRVVEQVRDLSSRMDREGGADAARATSQARLFAVIASIGGMLGVLVAIISLIVK
jgi:hypothetical protein